MHLCDQYGTLHPSFSRKGIAVIEFIKVRHQMLHGETLPKLFGLPDSALRSRPSVGVNSIAWNIWHLLRIEDITLSRFVANVPQVHTAGSWQSKMGIAYRHMGTAMPYADVEVLSDTIDLAALRGYQQAVAAQSAQTLAGLDLGRLHHQWDAAHMRAVIAGEAVCIPAITEGVISYWGALNVGRFVLDYTQVHPQSHMGEVGVIAGLLGVSL
jgi:hypothetical protein